MSHKSHKLLPLSQKNTQEKPWRNYPQTLSVSLPPLYEADHSPISRIERGFGCHIGGYGTSLKMRVFCSSILYPILPPKRPPLCSFSGPKRFVGGSFRCGKIFPFLIHFPMSFKNRPKKFGGEVVHQRGGKFTYF